jgi:hypothetical protein
VPKPASIISGNSWFRTAVSGIHASIRNERRNSGYFTGGWGNAGCKDGVAEGLPLTACGLNRASVLDRVGLMTGSVPE